MRAFEVNFDGIVGLTHNYAGLSFGNIASLRNKDRISNPKLAAKQGLAKMRRLQRLGLKQGILLPQERPHLPALRRLGFEGTEEQIIAKAYKKAPDIYTACCSASAMWTANAATVSPSADTTDGKVHFTPANLISKFHRSIETAFTGRLLRRIFANDDYFIHHAPLPPSPYFGDEGAANHTRLCSSYAAPGLEIFAYGREGVGSSGNEPKTFPARQSKEASEAVIRLHRLIPNRCFSARQHPLAIDAGVFHNDVIAVGNRNVFMLHEQAFVNTGEIRDTVRRMFDGAPFYFIIVRKKEVSLQEAVSSYLFNSQLVSINDHRMMLLVCRECVETDATQRFLRDLATKETPIQEIEAVDLRQSMQNGGGPACLRLRVVLNEKELAAMHRYVLLDDGLFDALERWIETYYRDRLSIDDLRDPRLISETKQALDELTQITKLGSMYSFQ